MEARGALWWADRARPMAGSRAGWMGLCAVWEALHGAENYFGPSIAIESESVLM
jgi:hypothetical protein